jgi:protease PrsW
MGLLVSFIIGFGTALLFAYILYWLDRFEKEPLLLLGGVFLWGAIVAAGSAFVINTFLGIGIFAFTGSEAATELTTGSVIAPLVEETLKGLAVLIVFLIFRREFDSVLDGIIYAGIAALGFAATENTYYIYTYGFQESGWSGLFYLTFVRIILVGWQHPFYTAFFGIGLAVARLNRSWAVRILAPLLGLGVAMFTHAFHNTLASFVTGLEGLALGSIIDWTGWLFMFAILIWATLRERSYLRRYLSAEVQAGTISAAHLKTASSGWLQMFARIASIFTGKYGKTNRFYQVCGEYAHKRQQYASLGDEAGNLVFLIKGHADA